MSAQTHRAAQCGLCGLRQAKKRKTVGVLGSVQPQAGELGSHDYLKRSIAYPVRRVYKCDQGNTSLEPKKLAQPWKGLGRFCQQ
jgi:hypothetical protein